MTRQCVGCETERVPEEKGRRRIVQSGIISEEIRTWVRSELWNQVPVSISVIDRQFRIVEANRMFAQNYGFWQDRLCYNVYKGRTEHCERCAADLTFSDGQIRVREEMGVVRDGQQTYYVVHLVPLVRPDGEIPYIIEASTDITATKKLEQEKLVAERLAAVGQTVAGLAHGIKNVLMGLEGGMYVVRSGMEKGDGERIFRGWQMLEENISRITTFVKGFLEFAKGKTPKVQLVDPNRIARKVVELFKDTASIAGIELRADLEEDIPFALMDEEGVHTCLANLVSNALDACEISDKGKPSRDACHARDGGVTDFRGRRRRRRHGLRCQEEDLHHLLQHQGVRQRHGPGTAVHEEDRAGTWREGLLRVGRGGRLRVPPGVPPGQASADGK